MASADRPQAEAIARRCVEEVANAIKADSGPVWNALRSATKPQAPAPAPVATLRRPGPIASLKAAWRDLLAACTHRGRRLTPEQRARLDQARAAAKERL